MTALKFSAPAALPPGKYPATVIKLSEGEGKFGEYIDWEFEVNGPDDDATHVSRRTSTKTGSGSVARVLVESLLGRAVRLDEEVDLDGLIGRALILEIETNVNGYDHIANATAIVPGGTVTDDVVDDLPF